MEAGMGVGYVDLLTLMEKGFPYLTVTGTPAGVQWEIHFEWWSQVSVDRGNGSCVHTPSIYLLGGCVTRQGDREHVS